ncbi:MULTISPECIES: S8 family serine peptidase [Microcystis]|jgi:subtilisin family serine protease|uniref:S8 family serine peptidase n=1 Tax=Microcystis wesenbergii NRERC-220 TaxID=3068991 RepID=A0ABU3HMY4_9CHRO|nr:MULTISPECIES: S8 family serine peptidase [Microcystis]MCZ8037906.1 S8 family serine peptidase [Microcystis sp. LE17-20A]MCZ8212852.1 S8 family serine peptidase [Microcystis sp. LE19-8.1F]MDT3674733.1 S8 family serine peptidase [Microcystis wesenbergii NRERC-220]
MTNLPTIPGLKELQKQTKGASEITVAILDGVVDTDHPCFKGAALTRLPTLVQHQATAWQMSTHGTHIASLIFGQPNSDIQGIALNLQVLSPRPSTVPLGDRLVVVPVRLVVVPVE